MRQAPVSTIWATSPRTARRSMPPRTFEASAASCTSLTSPTRQNLGDGRPHSLNINVNGFLPGWPEGTLMFAGQPGEFGAAPTDSSFGPDGLVIEDISDYQFRRPNPQIRIVSK